jgi:hypothetical protein
MAQPWSFAGGRGGIGLSDEVNLHRAGRVEMNVALRKRDVDPRLTEFAVDGQMQIVNHRQPVFQPPHENAELKIETVVPEAHEKG